MATPAAEGEKKTDAPAENQAPQTIETKYQKLAGPKLTGAKIDLSQFKKPEKKKDDKKDGDNNNRRRRRKRIVSGDEIIITRGNYQGNRNNKGGGRKGAKPVAKVEPTDEEVQKQVRETLEKLQGKSNKGKGAKYRREKRDLHRQQSEKEMAQQAKGKQGVEGDRVCYCE